MANQTSSRGQDGEIRVALDLATLDRSIYHAVHNLTILAEDGTTQIDHVLVSKFGIFVVETKNYAGWIFGSERQPEWTKSQPGRKDNFQNPLRQNYRHIKVLSGFLGVNEAWFHSVIAFCGNSEFKTPMPANVMDSGYADYIRSKQLTLLAELEVLPLVEKLKAAMLPRGEETDRLHLESLRERHANKEKAELTLSPPLGARGRKGWLKRKARHDDLIHSSPVWRDQVQRGPALKHPKAGRRRGTQDRKPAMIFGVAVAVLLLFTLGGAVKGIGSAISTLTAHRQTTTNLTPAFPDQPLPSTVKALPPQIPPVPQVTRQPEGTTRYSRQAKEEAWLRWYSTPKECETLSDRNVVECGNKHIRAKERFEQLYAQGKIR